MVAAGRVRIMLVSPSVTIVSVPREQFSRTRLSLQSILDARELDWPIIHVDGNSPSGLMRELAAIHERIDIVHKDEYLTGNEARNLALARVGTRYVIFIANDVQVWPGALRAMVKCAEKTGAWIVGPLCCAGAPFSQRVHVARCQLRIVEEDGRRRLHEVKPDCNEPAAEVRSRLGRGVSEEVEFHCLLARTELFDRIGALDEDFSPASITSTYASRRRNKVFPSILRARRQ